MDADELRREFPLLDGGGIRSAMVVENAGRLHFDVMRNWLMERSRADGNGRGVTYRTKTAARRILLGRGGEAVGVDFGDEKIHSNNIILAIGAFAVRLPQLVPGEESERIARNFTVTQRELFFANMPGVQDDTNYFLISPDMAIVRISTREGHASYGYAAVDDPVVENPTTDPRPNEEFEEALQIDRKNLFVGRTYSMLAECSTRWDSDITNPARPNLAVSPFGHSAGYYSAYKDDLPVVGKIGDTNITLAVGSHHSGVMGGQGIAELAVDHVLGQQNLSKTTHDQTAVNREPIEHTGLVL
jgi:glycine/D-amino acid oxidase-like deaminating enzyme